MSNLSPQSLLVEVKDATPPLRLHLKGRDAWAFLRLKEAGAKGCTPINQPAPRWSAYVHKLRRFGLDIESITEMHGGPYAGKHARYVLRSQAEVVA